MKAQTLVIKLSVEEFQALTSQAQGELRHPRDEARLIIRRSLLGESPPGPAKEVPTLQAASPRA